ncbi:MAG: hypothetical protein IJ728_10160 [Selenomonadaceae bacterium]|nr:hypothetical protein [Selenomonadaceae bacterium]
MIAQISNLFRRNVLEKIACILIAILLWIVVMDDQNPVIEGSYTVPLSFTDLPEGYKVLHSEQPVRINLRGPRSYFVNYEAKDFRAYADLAGLDEGDHEVKIEAKFPQGFELISVSPTQTQIKLDPYIERQMPADLIVTGAAGANATVTKVEQSSETVTLIASRTAAQSVTRVIGYVGLSGNKEDFSLQVPMTAINDEGRAVPDVRVVPSFMNVDVKIELGLLKKVVPIEPDVIAAEGFELDKFTVDPEQVEIAGKETVINSIEKIITQPITVPLGDMSAKRAVNLIVPEGVTVKSTVANVYVELKRKVVTNTTTDNAAATTTN